MKEKRRKMLNLLREDFKQAMKEKDKNRKDIIQMLRANITNLSKEKRVTEEELTQEDILGVIAKELKQQNDSLEAFKKGNRDDLVLETENKIEILKQYLPEQLTEVEIKNIIQDTMNELGLGSITNKEKGILMKQLMPKVKGKADGKLVNDILLSMLN